MQLKEIGNIVKPHGLKGDVVVLIQPEFAGDISRFKSVYVDRQGSDVPYMIERFQYLNGGKFKLKLAGIQNQQEAEMLRGSKVSQADALLSKQQLLDFTGYQVFNESSGFIGVVEDILDNKVQKLLIVKNAAHEHMIPLVENFVIEIDERKQVLMLRLPEGLLDL